MLPPTKEFWRNALFSLGSSFLQILPTATALFPAAISPCHGRERWKNMPKDDATVCFETSAEGLKENVRDQS